MGFKGLKSLALAAGLSAVTPNVEANSNDLEKNANNGVVSNTIGFVRNACKSLIKSPTLKNRIICHKDDVDNAFNKKGWSQAKAFDKIVDPKNNLNPIESVKLFQKEIDTKPDGSPGKNTESAYNYYFDYHLNQYQSEVENNQNNSSIRSYANEYSLPDITERELPANNLPNLVLSFDETNEKSAYEQFINQISNQIGIDANLLSGTLEKIYLDLDDDNIRKELLSGNFSNDVIKFLEESILNVSLSLKGTNVFLDTYSVYDVIEIITKIITNLPEYEHPDREKNTNNILDIVIQIEHEGVYSTTDDDQESDNKPIIISGGPTNEPIIPITSEDEHKMYENSINSKLAKKIAKKIFKQNNNTDKKAEEELKNNIFKVLDSYSLEDLETLDVETFEKELNEIFDTEKGSFDYKKIFETILNLSAKEIKKRYSRMFIVGLIVFTNFDEDIKNSEIFTPRVKLKKHLARNIAEKIAPHSSLDEDELIEVLYNEILLYLDGYPENLKRVLSAIDSIKLHNNDLFDLHTMFEEINKAMVVFQNPENNQSKLEIRKEREELWSNTTLFEDMDHLGTNLFYPTDCINILEIVCKDINHSEYETMIAVVNNRHPEVMRGSIIEGIVDSYYGNVYGIYTNKEFNNGKYSKEREQLAKEIDRFVNIFESRMKGNPLYKAFLNNPNFDTSEDEVQFIEEVANLKKTEVDVFDMLNDFSDKQISKIIRSKRVAEISANFALMLTIVLFEDFVPLYHELKKLKSSNDINMDLKKRLDKFFVSVVHYFNGESDSSTKHKNMVNILDKYPINEREKIAHQYKEIINSLQSNNQEIKERKTVGFNDPYDQVAHSYEFDNSYLENKEEINYEKIDYVKIIDSINPEIGEEWSKYNGEKYLDFLIKSFTNTFTNNLIENTNISPDNFEEINKLINETLLNLSKFLSANYHNNNISELLAIFIDDNNLTETFKVSKTVLLQILSLSISKIIDMNDVNKKDYKREKEHAMNM